MASISDSERFHKIGDEQGERFSVDSEAVISSTLHKRSEHAQAASSTPKRAEFLLGNSGELESHIEFYGDGTQARAQRELVEKECREPTCGKVFKVEKYRAYKVWYCRECAFRMKSRANQDEDEGAESGEDGENIERKRGTIKTFSKASQRRLMSWGNALKTDVKACFVTLTFPDAYYLRMDDSDAVYADLRRFEHRLRRRFPHAAYLWRREQEARKTGRYKGEIFPHFHLLVVGAHPYGLAEFVEEHWHEIAGMGDINHKWVHSVKRNQAVQMMRNRSQLAGYLRKGLGRVISAEMAKDTQIKGRSWGRFWGIAIWKNFVRYLSQIVKETILDSEAVQIIRVFEKIIFTSFLKGLRAREGIDDDFIARIKMKKRSYRSLKIGITVRDVFRLLTPQGERVFRSTKRPYGKPFFKYAYEKGWFKVEGASS